MSAKKLASINNEQHTPIEITNFYFFKQPVDESKVKHRRYIDSIEWFNHENEIRRTEINGDCDEIKIMPSKREQRFHEITYIDVRTTN